MAKAGDSDSIDKDIKRLRTTLQGVDFLAQLKVHDMDLLLGAMVRRKYKAGETVIRQGDKGDNFYIVASGKLSVWVKKGPKNTQIDTRWPEQFFGEMALVSSAPRMATLTTEEETELYVLGKRAFDDLLMANPAIAKTIKTEIAKRKAKS